MDKIALARDPNTPPETLSLLATNKDVGIRRLVGNNPSSTELFRRLVLMTNAKQDNKSLTDSP
jgi:hypothetical protein